jgi:predicted transcriptional regulator of viral defense system
MNFETFRQAFFKQICFTSGQVFAWYPEFDKNNLWRWNKKGYLLKLRQGYYMFAEHSDLPDIDYYVANCIYKPSYISLHTALAFFGLIPESVIQIVSITTLKTSLFKNEIGSFSYKRIKESLFWGYDYLEFSGNRTVMMAIPEKALLDLLYLYPFYQTEKEILDLRLNEDILSESIDYEKLHSFLLLYKSKKLDKQVNILRKVYNLHL